MSEPNHDSAAARTQCFALRGVRQYGAAADLFAGATARFPNDPALAFGLAQTRYELGYPAADLFARAQMPSVILAQLRPFRSRACSSRSKAARQRLTS